MTRRWAVFFEGVKQVQVRSERLPAPALDEVQMESICSAISAGTEMLIYRGDVNQAQQQDATIDALSGTLTYPLKYGYALIGRITAAGSAADSELLGQLVFAFQPHQSACVAKTTDIHILPSGLGAQDAAFLPNMETAVSFVMDGQPGIGERVAVLGQGIVGVLTSFLLSQFPLASLDVFDPLADRCRHAQSWGAHTPRPGERPGSYDLIFELSGHSAALNQAIEMAGPEARVVVGSWYGSKPVELNLGERFHRERLQLIGSQVSQLRAQHRAAWDKDRRLRIAWSKLAELRPSQLISHQFGIHQAAQAYQLLDEHPEQALQVLFNYVQSTEA